MSKNTGKHKERKNFTATPNKFLFENRLSVDSEKLKMNATMKLMYMVLEGYIKRAGISEVQIPLKEMAGFVCVGDTKTVRTTKEKLEALGLIKTRVEKIPGTKGNEKTYWSIVKHFTFEMQDSEITEEVVEPKVEEKIQPKDISVDVAGKIPLDLEENFHQGVEENFHHPGGKIGQKRKDSLKDLKTKDIKDKHVISGNPEIEKLVSQYFGKQVDKETVVEIAKQFNQIFSKNQNLQRCEELLQFFVQQVESKKTTNNPIENLVGYAVFIRNQESKQAGYLQPRKQEAAAIENTSTGNKLWTPNRIVRKEMVPSWMNEQESGKTVAKQEVSNDELENLKAEMAREFPRAN